MDLWIWVAFHIFVFALLAIDLGVFHRQAHDVSLREAAGWSITWVVLSLAFNVGVYYFMGAHAGLEFLTGYLIEKALGVDNSVVFLVIFSYFAVPAAASVSQYWGAAPPRPPRSRRGSIAAPPPSCPVRRCSLHG